MRSSCRAADLEGTVLVEKRKIAECAYILKQYFRDPKRPGLVILKSENAEQLDID
jgi:hypothetical protein